MNPFRRLVLLAGAVLSFTSTAATFTVSVTNDAGPGSLRAAITNANATPGPNSIVFNLPAGTLTLSPVTALPPLTNVVTVDGTSQPGFSGRPLVEISGAAAGGGSTGIRLATSNSVIRGLVLNRWRAHGIEINGGRSNVVEGCFIGTGASGTNDLGNSNNGILIVDSPGNRIGGTDPTQRNLISGNEDHGIRINGTNSIGNQILGNVLGLDATGLADLGNTDHGVLLDRAVETVIGGATPSGGNVISGNNGHGIRIEGAGGRRTVIRNNRIGLDASGLSDLGNNLDGISVVNSPGSVVGGSGVGNLVSGNGGAGLRLDGVSTTNTAVLGNRFGTDDTGVRGITNNGAGIEVSGNAGFNQVGGLGEGEGNVVAFSGADGVFVGSGTNNAVRGNTHFNNVGLGLDLGSNGVQNNDATDADTGANQLQNFPMLRRGVLGAGTVEIEGEIRSIPGTTFAVDVFASAAADASGNGEGEQFLGTFEVTTDAAGFVRFTHSLPVATALRFLTATATDPAGNTSEFSPALRALTTLPATAFVVTTTADSGPGSLRQALADANNAFNIGDRITFDVPGTGPHVIAVVTALPAIAAPVTLDGFTQPGASPNTLADGWNATHQIFLDGAAAPNNTDGLLVTAAGVTVRGLGITRFRGDGIELGVSSGGAVVEGNMIGLAPDGTDAGQNGSGVLVNGSAGHRIGGVTAGARNVLSGNNRSGVELTGAGATANHIEGNWIGVGLDGATDRGNSQQGIRVDNAPGNFLGGSLPGAGNVIVGNDLHGVELANAGSSNNVVFGNFIGSTAAGDPLRNNNNGVQLSATGNRIGGVASGEANRIAFNGQRGIGVQGGTNNTVRGNRIQANEGLGIDLGNNNRTANDDGDADTGANQFQNFPVLTEARIESGATRVAGRLNSRPTATFTLDFYSSPSLDTSGNGEGDQHLGATDVTTDASGNASFNVMLATEAQGRHLSATATDSFGNTSEFATNLVASSTLAPRTFTVTTTADSGPGSLRQALLDADASPAGAAHTLRFNIPGAGPHVITPETPLPMPATEAVLVDGYTQPGSRTNTQAQGNDAVLKIVLDGADQPVDYGLRLLVPGNTLRGLSVVSFRQNGLLLGGSNNVVEGCWIGLLPDGTPKPRDTGGSGITLANTVFGSGGSAGNRIGGPAPSERNVIGGHPIGSGLFIAGGGGSNNVIVGNYIGTDPSGTLARPNRNGISISGINSPDNRIGGAAAGEGNLISGNSGNGLRIGDAVRTLVQGNRIGTDVTGLLPLPNTDHGVQVASSPGTQVGGIAPGAGNRIAFNGRSGVDLSGNPESVGLSVRGNDILENGILGFDVGGFGQVDFNDVGDSDAGPNLRQNFPVITSARVDAASVTVTGSLDTLPSGAYQLDFYANRVADPSLHGEGEQYLGSQEVVTDPGGDATFTATFPVTTVGILITAIATDAAGNSSEFSEAFKASSSLGGETFVVTHTQDSGPGSLRQAILDSNATPTSGNRIEFNIPGEGVQVLQPATALPEITTAVTLDGYTQPGARANTLADGNDAVLRIHLVSPPATFGAGLSVSDSGSVVRGLAISGFAPGIALRGTNNAVVGCWIGLAPDGTERQNFQGLLLDQGRRNRIGGDSPADRNVISGNRDGGIRILVPEAVVAGNFIGTDPTGRTQRSNGGNGIEVIAGGDVTIGGPIASARNVIGAHTTGILAVQISSLLIANNHIGVDVTGTNALGNSTGVELSDVINARVDANVISANRFTGISIGGSRDGNNVVTGNAIGTDRGGTLRLGNARAGVNVFGTTPLRIGGLLPDESNVIAFNEEDGIAVPVRDAAVFIRGNRIFANAHLGIDRGDNGPASNDPGDAEDPTNAPRLTEATLNATSVRVRGAMDGAANASYRMDFFASPAPDPTGFGEGTQFLGSITNTTDAAGTALFDATFPGAASGRWITATASDSSGDTSEFGPALRAASTRPSGVLTVTTTGDGGPGSLREALVLSDGIFGAENTVIRFQIPGSGPFVIAPDRPLPVPVEPVTLDAFTQPGAAANSDLEGDNAQRLIHLAGTGLEFGEPGLVLAGQGGIVRGLILSGFAAPPLELRGDSNRIEGCLIESNRFSGIQIARGSGHRIGGPLPAQRNRFAANPGGHVVGEAAAGGGLVVQGNFIGVDADGRLDASDFDLGVLLASSGPSLVGGALPGEANWIRGANPVSITGGRGHTVRGNRVLSGGSPVPDLPVFGNDPGDPDAGPNDLQNSPAVTAATVGADGTRISGTLNSRPSATFVLDFYSIPTNQAGGTLVLDRYLGSAPVTTDAAGDVAFNLILPQKARRGRILATATDADGNTSETGPSALTTTEIPPPQLAVTSTADSGPGSLRIAMLAAEETFATGPGTIAFNIPGAGPHRIEPLTPLPRLTQAVNFDGFTQPGAVSGPTAQEVVLKVGLHGAALGPDADGLVLADDRYVVRGLIFTGFQGTGLVLSNAPGSTVERNWFGFDGTSDPVTALKGSPGGARAASGSFERADEGRDRLLDVGIEVLDDDDLSFNQAPLTVLLGNVVANTTRIGINIRGIKDLRMEGNTIGLDLDGFRHGGEILTGISLQDVSRVEILRGPGGSVYGRNAVAGCVNGIVMKNSRESRIEGNVVGGGAFGDWQLANRTAVIFDNVQVTEFLDNNVAFNERGVEVWGDGFGTQFRGNLFWDVPEYGFLGGLLSRGYRVGDFQEPNHFGIGLGSPLVISSRGVFDQRLNHFGAHGTPIAYQRVVAPAPSPLVTLDSRELTVSGFTAQPFDIVTAYTSDLLNQRLDLAANLFLEGGETSLGVPLGGPLRQVADFRTIGAVYTGRLVGSEFGYRSSGTTDLAVELFPVGTLGAGNASGTTRQLVEVRLHNRGSEAASFFTEFLAPGATQLQTFARVVTGQVFAPSRRFVSAIPMADGEIRFTGRLDAGEEVVETVAVTLASATSIQASIGPTDREERQPLDNQARLSLDMTTPGGLPAMVRFGAPDINMANVGAIGFFNFFLENDGTNPVANLQFRVADTPSLEWKIPASVQFDARRENNGLGIRLKNPLNPGQRLDLQLNFQARTRPAYLQVPGTAFGFPQAPAEDPPWGAGIVIVQDPARLDLGDAPDSYGTTLAANGPRHVAVPGFQMGFAVLSQPEGLPGVRANGDPDEEGVFFPEPLVPGTQVVVDIQASAPGRLDAWIDWNRNGVFDHRPATGLNEYLPDRLMRHPDPGSSYPLQPGRNRLHFMVPAEASLGATYARFRFSRSGGFGPRGAGEMGEVEDHRLEVFSAPVDFGDAPDFEEAPGYPTLPSHDGAAHRLTADSPRLGTARDGEAFPHPDAAALGDDLHPGIPIPLSASGNDEDGVLLIGRLTPGGEGAIRLVTTIPSGGTARVDGWVDWNHDFDWDDPGEQVANGVVVADGTNTFALTAPTSALIGFTYARIRISEQGGLSPRGMVDGGEVEDYNLSVYPPFDCRIAAVSPVGNQLLISWLGEAVLQQGPTLNGPWETVPGQTPGTTVVPMEGLARFFRLLCP